MYSGEYDACDVTRSECISTPGKLIRLLVNRFIGKYLTRLKTTWLFCALFARCNVNWFVTLSGGCRVVLASNLRLIMHNGVKFSMLYIQATRSVWWHVKIV